MSFNIKSIHDSFINADIRGSISIINTLDLKNIIALARRAESSENALFEAESRIIELERELNALKCNQVEPQSVNLVVNSQTTNIDVNIDTSITLVKSDVVAQSIPDSNEDDDNGFEIGKQHYRRQGEINKVKIIALAVRGYKPADIVDLVLKSEHPKRRYTKEYISSVYSPKTPNEINDILGMCNSNIEFLEGVSLEDVKTFITARYMRKVNRRSK